MSQSGDRCPRHGCHGRLITRTSKRVGETYVRRLKCNACGEDGGKHTVPNQMVFNRKPIV